MQCFSISLVIFIFFKFVLSNSKINPPVFSDWCFHAISFPFFYSIYLSIIIIVITIYHLSSTYHLSIIIYFKSQSDNPCLLFGFLDNLLNVIMDIFGIISIFALYFVCLIYFLLPYLYFPCFGLITS